MAALRFFAVRPANGRWHRASTRPRPAPSGFGLLLGMLSTLALVPAGASAEPFCTDTWTGGSSGSWQTEASWSAGHRPTSSDVACIAAGTTVTVSESGQHASVLSDAGTLVISAGSLELGGTVEASTVSALTISGGALTGAATLDISGSFISDFENTMSGSGSTVLLPGASGEFERGIGTRLLSERSFVNEGTLKLFAGVLAAMNGALVKNTGTLEVDRETPIRVESGGVAPLFVNEGTFQKVEGEGEASVSKVQINFENKGTVNAKKGTLRFFVGGSASGSSAKWLASAGAQIDFAEGSFSLAGGSLADAIEVGGANVSVSGVKGESAQLTLSTGSLSVTSGSMTVNDLTMAGGTLGGAGTMDVSGLLHWEFESTMSGSGSTVILPGATGAFEEVLVARLTGRRLVNEGTVTQTSLGQIRLFEGAEIQNTGTFTVNSESGINVEATGATNHFVNTGILRKTESTGASNTKIEVPLENKGTVEAQKGNFRIAKGGSSGSEGKWVAAEGAAIEFREGSYSFTGGSVTGTFDVAGASVSAAGLSSEKAQLGVLSGSLNLEGGTTLVKSFLITGGELTGSGTLDVSGSFISDFESVMSGSGSLVLLPGSVGEFAEGIGTRKLVGRSLVNEGTLTFTAGNLGMSEGALFRNVGTANANVEFGSEQFRVEGTGAAPLIVNSGTFEKTTGTGKTEVGVGFENQGVIRELSGSIKFLRPIVPEPTTQYGIGAGGKQSSRDPGQQHSSCGDPVNCATGNFTEAQTDFAVGGRGVGLELVRAYNSQAAAEGVHGIFGYGWTSSFSDHLEVEGASKKATLYQATGGTVPFAEGTGGSFSGPVWSQDVLSGSAEAGYTLTLANQTKYKFAGTGGRLESVTDRDGNATTLSYGEAGRLESITDPAGRKITLAYNGEGLVESAKDPLGHTVKYTYEGGNLASVTQPAEVGLRWQFKYDASHELTEMTDGRGGKTVNEYNAAHQLTLQKDPAERTLGFEYGSFHTTITNKTTGSVTSELFSSSDEPVSITRGSGTASATTETFTYNAAGQVLTSTDGDGHTTSYAYNTAGDRTSVVDPNKNETKWTYDTTHDVETTTTPKGETTTIKREAHGNPEVIERPAPAGKTQITKYKYTAHGQLESVTDPLENTWKYEYDTNGDRVSETDPAGDKRTWEYNEDSQETATVSPRGNITGGEPSKFTTKIERDAQGRPLTITDPLGHTTKYTYDGDGNVETLTDGNSHKTTYTYNADNQPTKVKAASGAVTETEYDGAGQVTSQTDGNKHTTKYTRNILEEVIEVTDPLGHKTTREYDAAGNLKSLTDPAKRTTSFTYDPANRLTEVTYSDGKTPTVKYEYDADGERTKMIDGTGTTSYTYDQLDRLSEVKDGHGNVVKYEYDLANNQTKITYPNRLARTRHEIRLQPEFGFQQYDLPDRDRRRRQILVHKCRSDERSQNDQGR